MCTYWYDYEKNRNAKKEEETMWITHNRLVYAEESTNPKSSASYNDRGLYLVLTTCTEWDNGGPFSLHTTKDPG